MIDKETWNAETDREKMEKLIKYKMYVRYHQNRLLKKTFLSNVKLSYFSMNDSFLNTMN